jgi:hypothetical protein
MILKANAANAAGECKAGMQGWGQQHMQDELMRF